MSEFKKACKKRKSESLGMAIFMIPAALFVLSMGIFGDGIEVTNPLILFFTGLCVFSSAAFFISFLRSDKKVLKFMETVGAHDAEQCEELIGRMQKFDDFIFYDEKRFLNLNDFVMVETENIYSVYSKRVTSNGGKHKSSTHYVVMKLYDGSEVTFEGFKSYFEANRLIGEVNSLIN